MQDSFQPSNPSLFRFDAKSSFSPSISTPGGPSSSSDQLTGTYDVIITGGEVLLEDCQDSILIHSKLSIGHMLGERQDRLNGGVFNGETEKEEEARWRDLVPSSSRLSLSPEETFHLFFRRRLLRIRRSHGGEVLDDASVWSLLISLGGRHFLQRTAVFSHLQEAGWTVRSGLPYGCQYLIYRHGPESFHASAGVCITGSLHPSEVVAVNRALTNVKKAVVLANVFIPSHLDTSTHECIRSIRVETITSSSFFAEKRLRDDVEAWSADVR